jgi:hypothetical protein
MSAENAVVFEDLLALAILSVCMKGGKCREGKGVMILLCNDSLALSLSSPPALPLSLAADQNLRECETRDDCQTKKDQCGMSGMNRTSRTPALNSLFICLLFSSLLVFSPL